jgi:sec-independent protein translocase protein TatA
MIHDLLQPRHLLVIAVVAVLMFGPNKLPELGKGMAEGIRGFKDAFKSGSSDGPGQV